MEEVKRRLGFVGSPRVFHWSPAEESAYATAYNSAKARHPDRAWPDLRLFDFLNLVVRKEPVVVRGALGFGLKAIGKAMHAQGLIGTSWADGPTDGLGAMVGAWSAAAEARRGGVALGQVELMREIERYNEVDCRVMAEVIGYLRDNH
jgi:Predicted nuclease (RecB family)